jgi:hypothetical protein
MAHHPLVSRLENALGPDRQLDLDIRLALPWSNNHAPADQLVPAFTERLDHVEAYIHRHLPDASWSFGADGDVQLWIGPELTRWAAWKDGSGSRYMAKPPVNRAIALTLALVRSAEQRMLADEAEWAAKVAAHTHYEDIPIRPHLSTGEDGRHFLRVGGPYLPSLPCVVFGMHFRPGVTAEQAEAFTRQFRDLCPAMFAQFLDPEIGGDAVIWYGTNKYGLADVDRPEDQAASPYTRPPRPED